MVLTIYILFFLSIVLASEATEQFPNNKQNHLDAIYSWNDREIDTKLGGKYYSFG